MVRKVDNPYTPNAGARPRALVGRDAELEAFGVLLERMTRGRTEQSMLVTGLRGVGKTVLLGALEEQARGHGWTTVDAEITKNVEFGRDGSVGSAAFLQVAPKAKWKERGRQAAAILKSFQLTVSAQGELTVGLDVDAIEGMADSGNLSEEGAIRV